MNELDFYRAMQSRYHELAGFTPDEASDIALRFHALAEQLALFSQRLDRAENEANPRFATGAALDSFAAQKTLSRKAAAYATGTLQFTRAAGGGTVLVPKGTLCATSDGTVYSTDTALIFTETETVKPVSARAVLAGSAGNAAANTITLLRTMLVGITALTNPAPFIGGVDAEPDSALRARLLAAYETPANGVNSAALRAAAEGYSGILSAAVSAGTAPASAVVCVAAAGNTGISEEKRVALEQLLNAMREPCASVSVTLAPVTPVTINLSVLPIGGFESAKTAIETLLRGELAAYPIGRGLSLARLTQLVMDSGFAQNCRFSAPANDLAGRENTVLRAGTITIGRLVS